MESHDESIQEHYTEADSHGESVQELDTEADSYSEYVQEHSDNGEGWQEVPFMIKPNKKKGRVISNETMQKTEGSYMTHVNNPPVKWQESEENKNVERVKSNSSAVWPPTDETGYTSFVPNNQDNTWQATHLSASNDWQTPSTNASIKQSSAIENNGYLRRTSKQKMNHTNSCLLHLLLLLLLQTLPLTLL
ncbi:hypothetical protein BDF14DRAFT_1752873 [Spinellus fusiger]|nr:hypothetical protein BDF14DRAFT_1752873 [Spinellus fusiger]